MIIYKLTNQNTSSYCYHITEALTDIGCDSYKLIYDSIKVLKEETPTPGNVINGITKGIYCDTIGLSLLNSFLPTISNILNKEIVPTYSFTREYLKGTELISHRDRDSCEISVSVTIHQDSLIEKFYISSKDKNSASEEDIITIDLKKGDAILFFGMDSANNDWHWRDPIQSNSVIQIFLHYCYKDGEYSNYAYEWTKP